MRINIVLILLISINEISCLKNGIPVAASVNHSLFVVTIWKYESTTRQYQCSGSIISQRHVITAGHCVHNVRNYEIYVTAGRIDQNHEISVIVGKIYLHHYFRKVYLPEKYFTEYWWNDIAILELENELIWGPHIAPVSLSYQEWTHIASSECYIIGWSYNTTISSMILQSAYAMILGDSCRSPDNYLLPHEIYAFLTATRATIEETDIGNSLICNDRAIGIIVGGRDRTRSVVTVLTFASYQHFIDYIIAGGVLSIRRDEYRDVVSITESGTFRCSGFMVEDRHIVTAAHCVEGVETAHLSVAWSYLEMPRISSASKWSSVKSVDIHPLYHGIENDIAVLKLESDLPRSSLSQFMDLPDPSQIAVDVPCKILRWNHPSSGRGVSKRLVKSYVTILNNERNQEFHLDAQQFRAQGLYGLPIANNEDIGSPIIFKNSIIGMVVAVDPSVANTAYSVTCLKIHSYTEFIIKILNKT